MIHYELNIEALSLPAELVPVANLCHGHKSIVTDVPMLVPIIIGTAVATSSTVEEFKFIKSGIYYIKICSDNDSI